MHNGLLLDFISRFNDESWTTELVLSVIILIVAVTGHLIFFSLLGRLLRRKDVYFLKQLRIRIKTPSLVLIIILALAIITAAFAPDAVLTTYVKHVEKLLIIFSITWLLIRSIKLGRDLILIRYDITEKDNLKARRVYTQFRIIERILIFLVVIIALAAALMTFSGIRQIGVSLFASAGVAGIILGFAAQKLIGTVLAGFQIAITQPIRIDDVVIVENEWGWIEEITLTYVCVRIWDKRRLIVPTPYFIEKPFQNWTRVSSDILGTVFIYTDYTVPIDALREELTRILKADKNWDGKVNVLQVTNSTERTVELRALMSSADSPSAWDLRVNVREKLISFLQKNYPQSLPKTRLTLEDGKGTKSDDDQQLL